MFRMRLSKVYAVCSPHASDPERQWVWTISVNPDYTGWETDSGADGYGLPKYLAEEYVAAINRLRGWEEELA